MFTFFDTVVHVQNKSCSSSPLCLIQGLNFPDDAKMWYSKWSDPSSLPRKHCSWRGSAGHNRNQALHTIAMMEDHLKLWYDLSIICLYLLHSNNFLVSPLQLPPLGNTITISLSTTTRSSSQKEGWTVSPLRTNPVVHSPLQSQETIYSWQGLVDWPFNFSPVHYATARRLLTFLFLQEELILSICDHI